jgi:hypothetical protein
VPLPVGAAATAAATADGDLALLAPTTARDMWSVEGLTEARAPRQAGSALVLPPAWRGMARVQSPRPAVAPTGSDNHATTPGCSDLIGGVQRAGRDALAAATRVDVKQK